MIFENVDFEKKNRCMNSYPACKKLPSNVLIDFLLTVKAATLIFISGRGSAKEGKSGFIYNLVKFGPRKGVCIS